MANDKIGVCVIGAGRAGMLHANNFARKIAGARLEAVADPRETIAEKAHSELEIDTHYLDYRRALERKSIDAVVIATPTTYHREIAVAAAQAGKHILCEKPMAMNVGECEEMIAAAGHNHVLLQIGFMRRFDPSFQDAWESVQRGDIGDIVLIKSLTHGPSVPQQWQFNIRASNGPLAEVNSHDIDTLRWFTGSEFKEVYALAGNYRCPEVRTEYPDFYDNVSMIASFANNMQGFIDGAVSVGYGYDARVEILGTTGVLFIGRIEQSATFTCSKKRGISRPFVKSWRELFMQAYTTEDGDFVRAILENRAPRVTGQDGKAAVQVVQAGNLSISEKRPVKIAELESR